MINFDLQFDAGDFVYREYSNTEWLDTRWGEFAQSLRGVYDEDVLNFAAKTSPADVAGLVWDALQKGKPKFRMALPPIRRTQGTLIVERFGEHVCLFVHRCKKYSPLIGVTVEGRDDKRVFRAEKEALRAAVKLFASHINEAFITKGIKYISPLNTTGVTCFVPEMDSGHQDWRIDAMILGHVLSRPNPVLVEGFDDATAMGDVSGID